MQCGTCGLAHLPFSLQHTYRLAACCCFRYTVVVYSEDNLKCINVVCGHIVDICNVKAGRTKNNQTTELSKILW